MSINKIENNQLYPKLNMVLEKTKITDEVIQSINEILNLENIDDVLFQIEKFKVNWKEIYKKYWNTIENKELILDYIFKNISRLLNDLNIERVYNNTSYLLAENISRNWELKGIKNFVTLKWLDISFSKISWASCNEWVLWLHNLVNEIVENDIDVKYTFQINKNDTHGLLYIIIWNKKYSFDSITSGFRFEEIEFSKINAKRKNNPDFFDNKDIYIDSFVNWMNEKDSIVYDYLWKKLKIVKKYWVLTIIYKNKPIKYININWFKRLTKNLSKLPNLKFIWLVPKVYNIDNIKEFIISKVNKKDREELNIILSKIHEEKLLQFFNLSVK